MSKTKELKKFYYVSPWAKDLLKEIPEKFELNEKKEFKFLTLKELGFTKDWIETQEFLNEDFLASKGLSFCNPEDGFQIAKDLKQGEYVYLGMKPIPDRGGGPGVFRLGSGSDGLKLCGIAGSSNEWWASRRWVFLASSTKPLGTENLHLDTQPLTLDEAIRICKEAGLTVTKVY
jgi:hypothetical protein